MGRLDGDDMLLAFTLGITGSLGHCAGMCSGIVLLLERALGGRGTRSAWLQIHAGRILVYSLGGLIAGTLGRGLSRLAEVFQLLQGAAAFYGALIGIYFVLVLLGLAPSPEILFPGLVRRWREGFHGISRAQRSAFLVGMAWGLLPCGLTLTALFTAALSASPLEGALRMAVFGLATLPVLSSVGWLARRSGFRAWPRYGAAAVLALFSLQIGLRGMAAYGFVEHLVLGGVMLW